MENMENKDKKATHTVSKKWIVTSCFAGEFTLKEISMWVLHHLIIKFKKITVILCTALVGNNSNYYYKLKHKQTNALVEKVPFRTRTMPVGQEIDTFLCH